MMKDIKQKTVVSDGFFMLFVQELREGIHEDL